MSISRKTVVLGTALTAFVAGACNDENDVNRGSLNGTFNLAVSETRDTCDGELNRFGAELTISRDGDTVLVDFGGQGLLAGSEVEPRVAAVEGVIEDQGGGRVTFMELTLAVDGDRINALGSILYSGTFPEVDDDCVQEFTISGQQLNVSPGILF